MLSRSLGASQVNNLLDFFNLISTFHVYVKKYVFLLTILSKLFLINNFQIETWKVLIIVLVSEMGILNNTL